MQSVTAIAAKDYSNYTQHLCHYCIAVEKSDESKKFGKNVS